MARGGAGGIGGAGAGPAGVLEWLLDRAARGDAAPGGEQALGELLRGAGGARGLAAPGKARLILSALRRSALAAEAHAPPPVDVGVALRKARELGHAGDGAWRKALTQTAPPLLALKECGAWPAAVLAYVEQAAAALPAVPLPGSPGGAAEEDPIEATQCVGEGGRTASAGAAVGSQDATIALLRHRVGVLQASGEDPLKAARATAAGAKGPTAPRTADDAVILLDSEAASPALGKEGAGGKRAWSMMHVQKGARAVHWEESSKGVEDAAEAMGAQKSRSAYTEPRSSPGTPGVLRDEDHRQRRRATTAPKHSAREAGVSPKRRSGPRLNRSDVRPSRRFGSGVRVRWTAEETEHLIKLVGEYGKKWSKIYDTSPNFWMKNGRSQVDLKDKFRNLAKKQRI